MKEVNKNDFYAYVGPKDLQYSTFGDYPYTGYFKTRSGEIMAKKVESYPNNGVYPTTTKYYIKE